MRTFFPNPGASMKLYFSPGACSLAPHIVSHELGQPLALVKVDTKAKRTEDGRDFLAINPKGYVPALELDDGSVLTEGPVISQYLADRKPEAGLVPAFGTPARYRAMEMLGYINSELHKSYSPLFNPAITPDWKQDRVDYLHKRYGLIDKVLARQEFIVGERFGIVDAYLFTVTNWAKFVKLDLSMFPALEAYQGRIAKRPAVQAAFKAEGLGK
jgi:glutathione S-transferase